LLGFGVQPALISGILSLTPVLTRRRSFAHFLNLLWRCGFESGAMKPNDIPIPLLLSLSERLATLRVDLINTPVTYYFHHDSEADSLAKHLPIFHTLAQAIEGSDQPPAVRNSGSLLHASIQSFAKVVGERFIRTDDVTTEAVLVAYAADHLRKPT
jgi:hypothetical protein